MGSTGLAASLFQTPDLNTEKVDVCGFEQHAFPLSVALGNAEASYGFLCLWLYEFSPDPHEESEGALKTEKLQMTV